MNRNDFPILLTWPSDGVRLFESMIPLGLASLAAVLREAGFPVRIVDFTHYRNDFRQDLKKWKPKLVGVGGTTATRQGSFLTARLVKEVLPQCPIVYGGPHASFAAEDTLENIPSIDFVLKGEAEWSLLHLAKYLMGSSEYSLESIAGLVYRNKESGCIVSNPALRIDDLGALPMPARDLFDGSYQLRIDHTNIISDFIVTSRGCPALCDFCSASRMFPGGVRLRPIEKVREELQWIAHNRPNVRGIKIFDSTFTANKDHVYAVAEELKALGFQWECELRVDTVDFAMLQHMKECGCVFVSMGYETTDEELLRKIGKRITQQQVDDVLEWCRALGIITKVFFTFGHLDQTWEQCKTDLRLMRTLKDRIDLFGTTIGIRVYPGTVLERKMQKRNMFAQGFSWAKYKAPKSQLLLAEPGNIMILNQPQLSHYKLALLIPMLLWNRTALSVPYFVKMIPYTLMGMIAMIKQRIRYVWQSMRRH